MSLTPLKSFRAVVKHRSMTGAAQELALAVSTVSTHVKFLTKVLGCTLLERTEDGYIPTTAGREVLASADIVFTEIELMRTIGARQSQPLEANRAIALRSPSHRPGSRPRVASTRQTADTTALAISGGGPRVTRPAGPPATAHRRAVTAAV